jgi:hypothetical protein
MAKIISNNGVARRKQREMKAESEIMAKANEISAAKWHRK